MIKKINMLLIVIFSLLACTSAYASGFEFGDKSNFPDMGQFKGMQYVIYKNADTDQIELAVISADDINKRSLMAEKTEQVQTVPYSEIHRTKNESGPDKWNGSGENIAKIVRPKLYLLETEKPIYFVRYSLNEAVWTPTGMIEESNVICENYDSLYYSSLSVIEVINKTKTAYPYNRIYNGVCYTDFDSQEDEYGVYKHFVLFSQNGINVDKKVEVPTLNTRNAGGAYFGNGIIIVMGTPDMALSDYQRPAGFNSGCMYIFDYNYNLINSLSCSGLKSCAGFLDGYFYFTNQIYTQKGQSTKSYLKSVDGINNISISKEEYDSAETVINKEIQTTIFNRKVESVRNDKLQFFIGNDDAKNQVLYDDNKTCKDDNIILYAGLGGKIILSKYWSNTLQDKELADNDLYQKVTVDCVYGINLPRMDSTKCYLGTQRCIWTTDEYVYIDQDIEYVMCIPTSQFYNKTYIQLNNRILGFSQPPVMESDRTLVPMRFLFEQMGADVAWNETTQSVTATVPTSTETQIQTFGLEQEKSVTFSIDNNTASVNGESETMDVPARLINDQTFVPLRFLSESLGYDVQWDDTTNTAIVTTE